MMHQSRQGSLASPAFLQKEWRAIDAVGFAELVEHLWVRGLAGWYDDPADW